MAGKRVLITGAGPIGLLVLAAARHAGATDITVTDLTDAALERARAMGATQAINVAADPDALAPLTDALRDGASLIVFPEGTRGAELMPAPFRSGLYHLAREFSGVELVPVYLDNLHRAWPKGTLVPVPVSTAVIFGPPLRLGAAEPRGPFLARARAAVSALGRQAHPEAADA